MMSSLVPSTRQGTENSSPTVLEADGISCHRPFLLPGAGKMAVQHFVLLDGGRLAFEDENQSQTILLVHGFPGTARRHLGSLFPVLQPGHRLIAPDLRGYGASRPPNRTFPIDFYQRDADDLAALLDSLAAGPVLVLGFSDGGEAALLLAASRPDLVRGVVAWGVSGVISAEQVAEVAPWLPVEAWGPEWATWRSQIESDHGQEQLIPLIEGWVQAAQAIVAAGGNICLDQASAIRCPVLLINGEDDAGNTVRDVRALAGRIAECRLVLLPGCGHWVHTEQPERFLALVQEFIASTSHVDNTPPRW